MPTLEYSSFPKTLRAAREIWRPSFFHAVESSLKGARSLRDRVNAEMGEDWSLGRCEVGIATTVRVSARTGAGKTA